MLAFQIIGALTVLLVISVVVGLISGRIEQWQEEEDYAQYIKHRSRDIDSNANEGDFGR